MKSEKSIIISVNNKLRSKSGESISETLVALLISALALVMLAGAIAAASRIVTKSRTQLKRYYNGNEVLVTTPTQADINKEYKANEIAVNLGSAYITVKVKNATSSLEHRYVNYYQNQAFSNKPVTSYKLGNPPASTEP